jgi:transposase
VQGDRGYDSDGHRRSLRERGIIPLIARRYTQNGSGLGVTRWVVERTLSWLHQFRRLRIRYERRSDIHESFMTIGCCLICWRFLENGFC